MAWIELHQTMNKHRKTLRLSSLLGISRREAVGLLCDLWLWAIDNADKHGLLDGLTAEDIGMALDMNKHDSLRTVQALVDAGYLVTSDGQYTLHDWYDYCGKLNEKRASDRTRKAENRRKSAGSPTDIQRTSDGSPQDIQGTSDGSPLVTVPNLTVPISSLRSDIESDAPPPKKPVKHKHGQYQNVLLTDEELEKVKAEFPRDSAERVVRMSEYIASKGVAYKSHLATIRAWAKKDREAPKGKVVGFQNYDQGDDADFDGVDLLAEARELYDRAL